MKNKHDEDISFLDKATPVELLTRGRFAPTGDSIFQGTLGKRFCKIITKMRNKLESAGTWSDLSKKVGWKQQ